MPKLIWVKGPRGPEPQVIYDDLVDGAGKSRVTCIAEFPITERDTELGVHVLARLFPFVEAEK